MFPTGFSYVFVVSAKRNIDKSIVLNSFEVSLLVVSLKHLEKNHGKSPRPWWASPGFLGMQDEIHTGGVEWEDVKVGTGAVF